MIRFGELTEDEVFRQPTRRPATGVTFENTGDRAAGDRCATSARRSTRERAEASAMHKNAVARMSIAADGRRYASRIRDALHIGSPTMTHTNNFPKLHNAAWPGLVGKGSPDAEPSIDLDTMLDLTAKAEVDGVKFDGVDLFLFAPHVDIDSTDDDLKKLADKVRSRNLVDRLGRRPGLAADRRRLGDGQRGRAQASSSSRSARAAASPRSCANSAFGPTASSASTRPPAPATG